MVLQFPIMADYALLPLDGGHCAFVTHGHPVHNRMPAPAPARRRAHPWAHACALRPAAGGLHLSQPRLRALPKEGQPKSYMIYEDGLFSIRALETGEELLAWRLGQ